MFCIRSPVHFDCQVVAKTVTLAILRGSQCLFPGVYMGCYGHLVLICFIMGIVIQLASANGDT